MAEARLSFTCEIGSGVDMAKFHIHMSQVKLENATLISCIEYIYIYFILYQILFLL